jgi:anti-sigma regulatory factor (Ser/Thr protein kinase)
MKKKIPGNLLSQDYLAKLTIYADVMHIRVAQHLVLYYAAFFGFNDEELHRLELATEEALINIIENAFDEGETGSIDLLVGYRPGAFVIAVEDRGIPTDAAMLSKKERSALGLLLIRHLADEFNIINLGKGGKRTELIKYLPEKSIVDFGDDSATDPVPLAVEPELLPMPIIRMVHPDDAPNLSRLAYRVYGYTYASVFYYPEKIRELIENGLLNSAVAVNDTGEIVGNLSLFFEYKGARVADSGAAMVNPRYRGLSLFKEMKKYLRDFAVNTGMYGLYSEAVTIHPFTQKGNLSLGAKETGIMLAFASENITFKKINNDKLSEQRQAVVLFYLKTNQEPQRKVYLCEKFYPVLSKVYEQLGLDREVIKVHETGSTIFLPGMTEMTTTIKPDMNTAVVSVTNASNDTYGLITRQVRELCLKKIETIYVELPVDEAAVAMLAAELNQGGFMLSGIVPELRNGDVLKLQYLNHVFVDPAKIVTVSDHTRELLGVIMLDYQ